jgi:hypothetical protein
MCMPSSRVSRTLESLWGRRARTPSAIRCRTQRGYAHIAGISSNLQRLSCKRIAYRISKALIESLPYPRKSGGDLEQIKFLLGHSSIQTTERYLGSEQDIEIAVNDNLGL